MKIELAGSQVKCIELDGKMVCVAENIESIESAKTEYGTPYIKGTAKGVEFKIQGGKAFGGTERDWWVEHEYIGTIDCTSRRDAIRLVNNF